MWEGLLAEVPPPRGVSIYGGNIACKRGISHWRLEYVGRGLRIRFGFTPTWLVGYLPVYICAVLEKM